MTALLALISLLPRLLLGLGIVHVVWSSLEKKYILIKLFLAGAVGFGLSSLLAFLWIWLGLPLTTYVIVETVFAISLTLWMLFRFKKDLPSALPSLRSGWDVNPIWLILLTFGSAIFVVNLLQYGFQFPHGSMDAWMNWNVVSRFLVDGDDWRNTFSRSLGHPDYPLFITLNNAITWIFLKKNSVWGPISFHIVIAFCTAGLLFSLINAVKGALQASLVVILFATQLFIAEMGMSQLADFPISYLILGTGGCTLLYVISAERRLAILAGFLAGLAAWTKNEGIVVVLSGLFIWIIIAFIRERTVIKEYLLGIAFPLAVVFLFKIFLAPSNDIFSANINFLAKITNWDRYLLIFREAGSTIWKPGEDPVSLIGLIIVYGLVIGRSEKRIRGLWTIGLLILAQLSAYFAIYLITPHDLYWHLWTSLSRLYMHILPLAFLLFFVWIKSPQELESKES